MGIDYLEGKRAGRHYLLAVDTELQIVIHAFLQSLMDLLLANSGSLSVEAHQ